MRGAFDAVLEHTCMSGLPPSMRGDYRRGIDLTLRRGELLIGVWFIEPALDPGGEGPPYPFSVAELTALFGEGYEVVDDYVPDVAFAGREGRSVRVGKCRSLLNLFTYPLWGGVSSRWLVSYHKTRRQKQLRRVGS
jgi:hypothetical protein